jgi:hypothetical protein
LYPIPFTFLEIQKASSRSLSCQQGTGLENIPESATVWLSQNWPMCQFRLKH